MSIKETFDTNCSNKQLILSARKSTTHEILLHQILQSTSKKKSQRCAGLMDHWPPVAPLKIQQYFCTNILSMS